LRCPQCRFPTRGNRGKCRVCGVVLAISTHRFIETISVPNRKQEERIHKYIAHRPCRQCGEPRPLLRRVDTVAGKVTGMLGFVLGVALAIAMLVLVNDSGFDTYFDQQTLFVKKSLGMGLLVLALLALDLIGWGLAFLFRTNRFFSRSPQLTLGRWMWLSTIAALSLSALIALLPVHQDTSTKRIAAPTLSSGIVPASYLDQDFARGNSSSFGR